MRLFILIFISYFLTKSSLAQSPQFDWASGIEGKGLKIGVKLVSDSKNNVICTGTYWNYPLKVGSSTFINQGEEDSFIVKYDSQGNIKWLNTIGGISYDAVIDIVVDNFDNVILTGSTYSEILKIGNYQLNSSQGETNAFTIKYDEDGNLLWAKSFGGIGDEVGQSIAIDHDNNIYIGGIFDSPLIKFANDTLMDLHNFRWHFYICKYDKNGNEIWAKCFEGDYNANWICINFDCQSNLILSGSFSGNNVIVGNTVLSNTSPTRRNSFLVSLDNFSTIRWLKLIEGDLDELVTTLITDQQCNIYLSGISDDKILKFDGRQFKLDTVGFYKSFYLKFSTEGEFKWAKSYTMVNEFGCCPMELDLDGNVYISGRYNTPEYRIGGTLLINKGHEDIYLTKLDSTSHEIWAKSIGTHLEEEAYDIVTDGYGNLYITGAFSSDTIYFDNNFVINGVGLDGDYFIAKLGKSIVSAKNLEQNKLNLYPNPANDFIVIHFDFNKNGVKFSLINLLGQQINALGECRTGELILNTSNIPNGVYLLQLNNHEATKVSKIIIRH
jgi:hypothetical protein